MYQASGKRAVAANLHPIGREYYKYLAARYIRAILRAPWPNRARFSTCIQLADRQRVLRFADVGLVHEVLLEVIKCAGRDNCLEDRIEDVRVISRQKSLPASTQ